MPSRSLLRWLEAHALSLLMTGLLVPGVAADGSAPVAGGVQPLDEEYTAEIRKHTTEPFFLTPYIDHLPASDLIPTPKDVLGHIAGAPDVLSYSHEVYAYLRAVAEATPRVEVFNAGTTEEGREIIFVAVSGEQNMARLARWKEITARLADPRTIRSSDEARALIAEGRLFYWMTGAMHSPETGSPEMLMELVYRLAADESDFIRMIRDNVVVLVTPILEVDGRDKRVDLLKLKQADPKAAVPRLIYWGHYVAHDNNRDALALSLALSRHCMRTFLEYHPQVMHDLHESVSFLYTSTGTGPYNPWVDPILIDEWHLLAYEEITEMTKLGVPGIWTHGFYDGWAPNYAFYAANGHNAIGRFYETQGAGDADTRRITTGAAATRTWYRPNPPLPTVMWSIRNNVNLQQSCLLIALNYVARHRERFLENFYVKNKRAIEKATTEGPAAYVLPADDPRPGQAAALLSIIRRQGGEVRRAARDFSVGDRSFPAGSYILRMDQPYSRMIDMLLDRAYFNVADPRPYDDTGWTLGPLFNVRTERIEDTSILSVLAEAVPGEVIRPAGAVEVLTEGPPQVYLINHNADNALATFRFKHAELHMSAAEKSFTAGGVKFNAGTFFLPVEGNPPDLAERLRRAAVTHGLRIYSAAEAPAVATHRLSPPRVAVMHTWLTTQTEGWVRLALDEMEIPYDYISVHEVRDAPDLRARYDAILLGPSVADAHAIVRGLPKTGKPIAWKKTDVTPNLGRPDETDDMRGGLELEGVLHLRDFVRQGGLFIALTSSVALPIQYGLAEGVSIRQTRELNVRGSVLRATFDDEQSPLRYGYDDTLGVYFSQSPVLRVGGEGFGAALAAARGGAGSSGRPSGRGGVDDPDIIQARPRDWGKEKPEELEATGAESGSSLRERALARLRARGRRPGEEGPNAPPGGGEAASEPVAPQEPSSTAPAAEPEEPQEEQGRLLPRVILKFQGEAKDMLVSGMLEGASELNGAAAVVDVPLGDGHIVLFAINPMWRHITHGSFALVTNGLIHWDALNVGARRESRSEETERSYAEAEGF